MPGSSLWLIPPPHSSLYSTLNTLINTTIPATIPPSTKTTTQPPPHFSPHVTLTADTVTPSDDPQQWLDRLSLPETAKDLRVQMKEPQVGEIFFRKLTLRCEKNDGLKALAGACRRAGTGEGSAEVEDWVEGVYAPHLSLLYSDLPPTEVEGRMDDIKVTIEKAQQDNAPEALSAQGAEIWLVPTFQGLDEWRPIARRRLEGTEWRWES